MFKIIAIRPLEGCKESVLKCLKENQFYYLCNDYVITDKYIKYRNQYVRLLPEDFFSLHGSDNIKINVSAIVGMNGDGKSSIVELMMRLINNCAKHYKLTTKVNLLRVEGVKAELYYLLDDVVYCIRETKTDKTPKILKIANLSDNSNKEGQWSIEEKTVQSVNKLNELFATIVSNYSHYAYNTNDFKDERSDKVDTDINEQKCWLYYLFNNEEQTPLVVHPYRVEGNIDINRETQLAMHRLMALYIQEPSVKENEHSFRKIGGNHAEYLKLSDIGFSKLQEWTIVRHFIENKTVSYLKDVLNQINALLEKDDDVTYTKLCKDVLPATMKNLDYLTGITDSQYEFFLFEFMDWMKGRRKAFSNKSDIRQLIQIQEVYELKYKKQLHHLECFDKYMKFGRMNVCQLVRCRMVFEIMRYLHFNMQSLFKDYDSLTDIERCQHYIVYKVIDICATSPFYRNFIDSHAPGWNNNISIPHYTGIIEDAVGTLINKDKSNLSLGIRQCLNFIKEMPIIGSKNIYKELNCQISLKQKDEAKESLYVRFDDLNKLYGRKVIPLILLPPPIYNVEVIYESEKIELIPYHYLSSGEKQLLNIIGALIYLLRCIDSDTDRQYENVNLILEEIELYFHPDYQRKIIKRLLEKLYSSEFERIKRINILFVTHSPFILSDIPLCNVLFLKKGEPSFDHIHENTFGANIHGLLRNGFFLPSLPIGEFAYEKINRLFEKFNRFEFDNDDKEWFYSNIMRVGEPYLREQLMKSYNMHFNNHNYD